MQSQSYSPFLKLILQILVVLILTTVILINENKAYTLVLDLGIILYAIVAGRNYRIIINFNGIIINRLFSQDSVIQADDISKIELETIRYGKRRIQRLYVYASGEIYELGTTWFIQAELVKGLIGFCASNSIEMDVSKFTMKEL